MSVGAAQALSPSTLHTCAFPTPEQQRGKMQSQARFSPICACALARSGGCGSGLPPQKPLALPGGATTQKPPYRWTPILLDVTPGEDAPARPYHLRRSKLCQAGKDPALVYRGGFLLRVSLFPSMSPSRFSWARRTSQTDTATKPSSRLADPPWKTLKGVGLQLRWCAVPCRASWGSPSHLRYQTGVL